MSSWSYRMRNIFCQMNSCWNIWVTRFGLHTFTWISQLENGSLVITLLHCTASNILYPRFPLYLFVFNNNNNHFWQLLSVAHLHTISKLIQSKPSTTRKMYVYEWSIIAQIPQANLSLNQYFQTAFYDYSMFIV